MGRWSGCRSPPPAPSARRRTVLGRRREKTERGWRRREPRNQVQLSRAQPLLCMRGNAGCRGAERAVTGCAGSRECRSCQAIPHCLIAFFSGAFCRHFRIALSSPARGGTMAEGGSGAYENCGDQFGKADAAKRSAAGRQLIQGSATA